MINQGRDIQYQNLLKIVTTQRTKGAANISSLRSGQMRSILNVHRLAEAYKKNSKVAYVSEQFPTEIVFAFDIIPWNIESMTIMLAQSLDVNRILQMTQEQQLSRDICSFLRGPFGMMLADCYPQPDMILANDQPCEGLSKLEYMAAKHYNVPFFALHTPNTIDDDAIDYLVQQMKHMITEMEEHLKIPFRMEVMQKVVRQSNDAKAYYCRIAQLLESHTLPGVSRELQEIFGMNYFGLNEITQTCKFLYEEAIDMAQNESSRSAQRRLLWAGQAPEAFHNLLVHIGSIVDIIFWAPLWEANFLIIDEDDPLRSIARRAILYHWNMQKMRSDFSGICDRFHIDGVIIANVWGCRNIMGISSVLREVAIDKKLKCLSINIDIVDRNNYVFPHIKNRVDAFLEIMQ